jgi:hypothetical protein
VEQHLTRVNGGHLVRVVGPGFELVRAWAEEGVPLSVVFRGIELKAERHAAGQSRRPLRIEFCESDVRDVYDGWRRAIGLHTQGAEGAAVDPAGAEEAGAPASEADGERRRRPSLSRHLERVVERLVRAAGRLDLQEGLRAALASAIERVTALRERAHGARGDARAGIEAELGPIDRALMAAVRAHAPAALIDALRVEAEQELAPFRARLAAGHWQQSLDVTIDRLLRDRYGLPLLEL